MATAPKKLPPWMAKSEKGESKKSEKKESMKMMGKEKKAGIEKHMASGKAKKGGC